jgi:peptide chain release factor 3
VFNLLDTPGHEDFSEDTYRTLTAVDSAVMVIDAAKGIEARTRKLFEVCRLRDIPIVTFINKMDRESRDPFDLLDEIEKTLALDTAPLTWPLGRGREFAGTYRLASRVRRWSAKRRRPCRRRRAFAEIAGPRRPRAAEGVELAREACRPSTAALSRGPLTPVFFRSALRNFGVGDLSTLLAERPPPRARPTAPVEARARMRPSCSRSRPTWIRTTATASPSRALLGQAQRGMKASWCARQADEPAPPQFFFAQDRAIADEAFAGDIVGIPNHGTLRIGDTLTEGEDPVVPRRAELRAGNHAPRPRAGRHDAPRSCARR